MNPSSAADSINIDKSKTSELDDEQLYRFASWLDKTHNPFSLPISVEYDEFVRLARKSLSKLETSLVPKNQFLDFSTEAEESNSISYVSKDAQENADNEHSDWEVFRKIKTDDERYRRVRERWMNITVPDPNRNLTTHNFRAREWKGRKRVGQPKESEMPAKKKIRCTEVFHEKIKILKKKQNEIQEQYKHREITIDKECEKVKRNIFRKFGNLEERNYCLASFSNLCQQSFDAKKVAENNLNEIQNEINALVANRNEVYSVFKFYSKLNNSGTRGKDLTLIDEHRLKEIREKEEMYEKFFQYYRS